ncbi:MAG TPA: VWA domain-containing protein [Bryobacteraceae bacterium]|nr:VWA domain-containing protein [Bryobacteraceae bacterium]
MSHKLGLAAALAATLGCAVLPAQTADAKVSDTPEFTFRTEMRLVDLHATVVDSQGHLLLSLPQSAFSIYENGVKQQIKVFRREDVPVSLGLVIDNSASMRDKRAKVGSAALALVAASNPEDEVFIMNFNDKAYLEQDFTNNIKDLEATLKTINSKGETAMRDALRLGIEHLKHSGKKEKKVLLVVSDGEDNSSVETLDHLIQAAQQEGVLIYAVGLLSDDEPREAERAKRQMDALTLATGGQSWYPKDLSEVEGIAREVAHDIRNQYILGYISSNQSFDGSFRRIRVTVNERGAAVRTRSGYYATPDANR